MHILLKNARRIKNARTDNDKPLPTVIHHTLIIPSLDFVQLTALGVPDNGPIMDPSPSENGVAKDQRKDVGALDKGYVQVTKIVLISA